MAIKLRRTIYIGAGGTGVETVLQVRNYFRSLTKDGSLPPMIKCLFIDTNENEVRDLDDSVNDAEILSLAERSAKAIYLADQKKARNSNQPGVYETYTNMRSIRALTNGAGQYRSHGRFAVMCKENMGDSTVNYSFSSKFRTLYKDIKGIDGLLDDDFETIGGDVEVHIAFSMSGGTGAGLFLSLAYLIKEIIPTCKIVAYAFSPSFFMNLPTKEQIQQNTYASLIELDYCMSSEYLDSSEITYPGLKPIKQAPFDAVMYIDNDTYTREGDVKPFSYNEEGKKKIEENVAYAMAIAAGDMGVATNSIFDNLVNDIGSGQYNVTFSSSNEIKRGWVSSLGIAQLSCKPDGERLLFANNIVLRILKTLKEGGRQIDSSSAEAYDWVKELDLNESGDAFDRDAVINTMISPSEYLNTQAHEITEVSIESGYSAYIARVSKPLSEEGISERKDRFVEKKKKSLLEKTQNAIFVSNTDFINVINAISIIEQFESYMKSYASILSKEKVEKQGLLKEQEKRWKVTVNELRELPRHTINRAQKVAVFVNDLRSIAQKRFELDCQIRCRDKAICAFEEIKTYASEMVIKLKGFLGVIDNDIKKKEDRITNSNINPTIKGNVIDLTDKAKSLPTTDTSRVLIDLNEFFKSSGSNTILDFINRKSFIELAERFGESLYKENMYVAESPVIRVLKSLSDDERTDYFEKAYAFSSPYMEIEKYGERVKTTEHIYVALPGGINCDPVVKGWLTKVLQRGTVQPQWVDINDPNRIIIYRQIGVIPPYFISGIATGMNGIYYSSSCQEAFERKDDPRNYCPFTDTQFDALYHKWGYSLESNIRDVSNDYLTWVKAIVLELIVKGVDGTYKVVSDSGEPDVNDPLWRKFKQLGNNRFEAFNQFASDVALCNELSSKINEMMKDRMTQQKWSAYVGNPAKYGNDFIDRKSQEWQIIEVQRQCTAELGVL